MLFTMLILFGELLAGNQAVETSDLQLFPSSDIASTQYYIAKDHYDFCSKMFEQRMSPWIDWRSLQDEAGRTLNCWEMLYFAHAYSWDRLDMLHNLKMRLGYADYYHGRMPVPQTWHKGFVE